MPEPLPISPPPRPPSPRLTSCERKRRFHAHPEGHCGHPDCPLAVRADGALDDLPPGW